MVTSTRRLHIILLAILTLCLIADPRFALADPDDDFFDDEPGDDDPIFTDDPGDDEPLFDDDPAEPVANKKTSPADTPTEASTPQPSIADELPEPTLATLGATANGSMSYGQLGEDHFLTLQLGISLTYSKLAAGLSLPIRLRVVDNEPSQDGELFRSEDFDEAGDYLRWIKFIQWAQANDAFFVRLGDLQAISLGHATLMNEYLGTVSLDHFQPGLHTRITDPRGGLEAMIDNVIGPEVFGMRAYVRPYAFVNANSTLSNLSFGASFVADVNAPIGLRTDPFSGQLLIDESGYLLFEAESVYGLGLDTDFPIQVSEDIIFRPYVDLNFLLSQNTGIGLHLGTQLDFALPSKSALTLAVEYQNLSENYLSQYFDTLYELQRLIYPSPAEVAPGEIPQTKKSALDEQDENLHGVLVHLLVDAMGLVQLSGTFRDYQGPKNASILLRASTPALSSFTLGALYTKAGIEPEEIFSADGAMMQLYIRSNVVSFVDVITSFTRTWHLVTDPSSSGFGTYETRDEWNIGLGTSMPF